MNAAAETRGKTSLQDLNLEYLKRLEKLLRLFFKRQEIRNKLEEVLNPDEPETNGKDSTHVKERDTLSSLTASMADQKKRIEDFVREAKSRDFEIPLENLAASYGLSEFEKYSLAMLFFSELNLSFMKDLSKTLAWTARKDCLQIGDLVNALSETTGDLYENRKYFSCQSKFVQHSLVQISYPYRGDNEPNVLNFDVDLPHEIMKYIMGDKNDYFSMNDFMTMERPEIRMENVILEDGIKDAVKLFLDNRERYRRMISKSGLCDITTYGTSPVFLFYGVSGTGKTMLARATANYLNKPLITIHTKFKKESLFDPEIPLKDIFRKASLMDSVLFIDECENLLERRSSTSRSLLIELERCNTLVILATNQVNKLSPSLDRRIALKVHFQVPGIEQRKLLWKIHLPEKHSLSSDIDPDALARRFIFPGGYIKNAVIAAAHLGLKKSTNGDFSICQKDLLDAAQSVQKQMLRPLFISSPVYPCITMNSICLTQDETRQVSSLINVLKKRGETEKPLRILFCGSAPERMNQIAQAMANNLSLPCHLFPMDLFYNDKSRYFTDAPLPEDNHFGYYGFLHMIKEELSRLDSILILTDDTDELLKKSEKGDRNLDILHRQILSLGKPVMVLSGASRLNPMVISRYFDFILPINTNDKQTRLALWQKLRSKNMPLSPAIDLEKIAETYPLTEDQIKDTMDKLIKDHYYNGSMEIQEADIQSTISDIQFNNPQPALFGSPGRNGRFHKDSNGIHHCH